MAKFSSGVFIPKNPRKYAGSKPPVYRSSWEHKVFIKFDENRNVLSWASEPVTIPYINPIKPKKNGMPNFYTPDLLVKYLDKDGKVQIELIEIKPLKETLFEHAKTKKDKLAFAVNQSKWQQAEAWCQSKGIKFRVITEKDIFGI